MLLIQNARILGHNGVEDILISDEGKYLKIAPKIDASEYPGAKVIDAKEMLAAPTFVNTHMHFDKAYTSLRGREDSTETLEDSIRIMHDRIRNYTVEDVRARATRAIRALPRPDAAVVPILAMTANAFEDDVIAAREAGMNGHIAKPIDIARIRSALCAVLRADAVESAKAP